MRYPSLFFLIGVASITAETKVSCTGASPYNGSVYLAGNQVVFNNRLWRANWYAQNPPSSSDLAWTDLGECDSPQVLAPCTGEAWNGDKVYATPTTVVYDSATYRNKWYASGSVPPSPEDSNWTYLGPCSGNGDGPAPPPATTTRPAATTIGPVATTTRPAVPTTRPTRPTVPTQTPSPTHPVIYTTPTEPVTTPARRSTSSRTTPTLPAHTTRATQTKPRTTAARSTTKATAPATRPTAAPASTTPPQNPQVKPTGPVGPNNECVWPYVSADYTGGTYVGVGDKVYKNKYWAGADEKPGVAAVWELVATCNGTAPKAKYTDAEMLGMIDPGDGHIQVIKDPWTALLPTDEEMAQVEAAAEAADPKIAMLKQAARVLPRDEIEAIAPLRAENPENVKRVESIVSESEFDRLLPVRHTSYTYVNFLRGIGAFPDYCKTYDDGRDSDAICRKFLAVSFAHNVQETGGNTPTLPYGQTDAEHTNPGADKYYQQGELIPTWRQALWFLREVGHTESESTSAYEQCGLSGPGEMIWGLNYPCAKDKTYFGRGSKQLSWNYNYGMCSQKLFGDSNYLLEHPDLVADSWLNFGTAIWFAVTPQSPKPPMTWVIDGTWVPNAADTAAGLSPGFGATIMVINGGIECGGKAPTSVGNRVNAYKNWAAELGVPIPADEDLDCSKATAFPSDSAAATNTYWSRSWNSIQCQLVKYQTPWQVQNHGDYSRCVDYYFRSHFFRDGKKVSDYGDVPAPIL